MPSQHPGWRFAKFDRAEFRQIVMFRPSAEGRNIWGGDALAPQTLRRSQGDIAGWLKAVWRSKIVASPQDGIGGEAIHQMRHGVHARPAMLSISETTSITAGLSEAMASAMAP